VQFVHTNLVGRLTSQFGLQTDSVYAVRRLTLLLAAVPLLASGCGGDDDGASAGTAGPPATTGVVVDAEAFPADRCQANRDAGTITYLTGFDYAASASMVEVMVAEEQGYFDDVCLDVSIEGSFSTDNYPLVAAGEAQFASAGSFSEAVSFAQANDTEFAVSEVYGRGPIDSLIVKPGQATTLDDLRGTTIGVKGKLPSSVEAMLATAGLREGDDFETVLLDGFDPTAHIAVDSIVGFPGYKSNEPGALDRAGIDHDLFDPVEFDVAGSFGVVYTSREFLDEHPTAAADFVRASLRAMEDALADPEAAATIAVERINTGGNPNFLTPEGETFRWTTEAALIASSTPDGQHPGVPDAEQLQAELDQNAELGLFGDGAESPAAAEFIATDVAASAYADDGSVVWPD
jgi:ABC-type nitrate/sulfonate/bicarbonate transport system substrate-binding protein